MKSCRGLAASAVALACLSWLAAPAQAEEPWQFRIDAFFDRHAVDDGDELPGSILLLEPRFGAGIFATRTYDLQNNHDLGLAFGLSTERYPDNPRQNRLFFDAGGDYIIPLSQGALRQLRFGLELRHARNDDDWVYNRGRVAAALRFQPAQRNTIQLRARLGYRDQNEEETFVGYDQTEYLLDVQHNWRSAEGMWRTTSFLYFEHREADSINYTYNEGGVRLIGRRTLTETVSLVGRTNVHLRDYENGIREDHFFRGTLGIDWDVGDGLIVSGFGGYETNDSTVLEKDYDGGIFGFEVSKTF